MTTPNGSTADPDVLLEALADRRRRAVVRYLLTSDGPAALSSVVDVVVRAVDETPEYARVGLVHTHLPELDDAGVVAYDPDRGRVAAGVYLGAGATLLAATAAVTVPAAGVEATRSE